MLQATLFRRCLNISLLKRLNPEPACDQATYLIGCRLRRMPGHIVSQATWLRHCPPPGAFCKSQGREEPT